VGYTQDLKQNVHDFWNRASCGEYYANGTNVRERLLSQAAFRYQVEPYIPTFARFTEGHDKDVLELGVGMGADHLEWARSRPRSLVGVDLTSRAIEFTRTRLAQEGYQSDLRTDDIEDLPFRDHSFDMVYAWGVIHHTPDIAAAIREIHRVLRPGGTARVMIYHRYAMVGYMLWLRYALCAGRLKLSLDEVYASFLESPGTRAFSVPQARKLFAAFTNVQVKVALSPADLLQGDVGQRHRGRLLAAARRVWPRWLIRRALPGHGLNMMIEASK
jgi:SAM-dependent methyltransferase